MARRGGRDEDALALVLRALGVVATSAGARGVLRGPGEVSGLDHVPAAVDSEYRFYAAWYLVAGVAVLHVGKDPAAQRRAVRLVHLGLWTAAAGRVLSLRHRGLPGRGQLVLLGVEVALPLVLSPWQGRVGRAQGPMTR